MKRAIVAAAVAGTLLSVGAPAASAGVDRVVYRCEGTGTWNVSFVNLTATATRSISAPTGACKKIHAGLADDGDFTIRSFDASDSAGPSAGLPLVGVSVTGVNAFAGVILREGSVPTVRGPIAIAGNLLNATITGADATPWAVTEIHVGDGSCGTNCYRTKAVWIGTYSGNQ